MISPTCNAPRSRPSIVTLMLLLVVAAPGFAQTASNYVLGSGDIISISVYEEIDLSFPEMRIGDTGLINYPFLGELNVAGRTTAQLEQMIHQGLVDGEFLINPAITVSIVQYRPFYINGEVARPGSYPYEPGLTLRKAVSIAGGFTERANQNRLTVHGEGASEDGEPSVVESLDVTIGPGDIVTVDERFF